MRERIQENIILPRESGQLAIKRALADLATAENSKKAYEFLRERINQAKASGNKEKARADIRIPGYRMLIYAMEKVYGKTYDEEALKKLADKEKTALELIKGLLAQIEKNDPDFSDRDAPPASLASEPPGANWDGRTAPDQEKYCRGSWSDGIGGTGRAAGE